MPAPFGARLAAKQGRVLPAGDQELVGVEGAAGSASARQVEGVGAALQAAPQGGTPPPALPTPVHNGVKRNIVANMALPGLLVAAASCTEHMAVLTALRDTPWAGS